MSAEKESFKKLLRNKRRPKFKEEYTILMN